MASKAFGARTPRRQHLIRGKKGVAGEVQDLRTDVDDAFQSLELSFATPQALAAYEADLVTDGAVAYVGVVNDTYGFMSNPSASVLAAVDAVNIVAAASPAGAVWLRRFTRNIPAQYETAWYLDAVIGDDRNTGTSALAPLKTMAELTTRLRGARIGADVTVTVAAGDYSNDPVRFDVEILSGVSILMVGAVTSTSDTIAAILPTVAGAAATNSGAQRGALTSTTYAFAASDDRRRLRVTSGAAVGGIAYITKVVTTGAGGVVNVTRWGKLSNPRTSTSVTHLTPSASDGYAIDTLASQLGYLDMRVRGPGRFIIQDCLIRPAGTASLSHRGVCDNGALNGVQTYGCIYQSGTVLLFQGGPITQSVCSLSSDTGSIVFSGAAVVVQRMCVWTGTASVSLGTVQIQDAAMLQLSSGLCIDGCTVLLQRGAYLDQIAGTNFDIQFCDGTGTRAVEVAQAAVWWSHSSNNLVWGLNNAYSSSAVLIDGGGQWFYGVKPSIPGGTTDWNIGGTTGAWASLPVFDTSGAGSGALFSD